MIKSPEQIIKELQAPFKDEEIEYKVGASATRLVVKSY